MAGCTTVGFSGGEDTYAIPLPVLVDLGGRHLHFAQGCGDALTAVESGRQVILSYKVWRMPPGTASRRCFPTAELSVDLVAPLGDRQLIDGITHKPVTYLDLDHLIQPAPATASPTGPPEWSVGTICPSAAPDFPGETGMCADRGYRLNSTGEPFLLVQSSTRIWPVGTLAVPGYTPTPNTVPYCTGHDSRDATCVSPTGDFSWWATWPSGDWKFVLAVRRGSAPVDAQTLATVRGQLQAAALADHHIQHA